MSVNAWSQDNDAQPNEQAPVSLVELHSDGRISLHPALVSQFAPQLISALGGNPPAPTLGNMEALPETSPVRNMVSAKPFQEQARRSLALGRRWASEMRRLMRFEDLKPYAAYQEVALRYGEKVSHVRNLVEVHNSNRSKRIEKMRLSLVWRKHLEGMTDRQIGLQINQHAKTVAKYRKKMKQKQKGAFENV